MSSSLGVSVGTLNLVAALPGGAPTLRRAVLTLFPHRAPEVGVPAENPRLDERGLVLTDFVERVGDPVPIVASDGSTHRGDRLVADALDALTRDASAGSPPDRISVAVPAHWQPSVVDSLRAAVADKPSLSPRGEPPTVVSDAVAALTALQAQPGLPARGVVALCDFGATGTSITLVDAGAGFSNVGPTVRYNEFSGDLIDQAVLRHVLADLPIDPSATSAVADLRRIREQCRLAKERLSYDTATGFTGPLPGPQSTVRITRGEFEELLRHPLDGVIAAIEDALQCNRVAPSHLVAVASVGGGARIPLVTQRLSEALRMPVTTTSQAHVLAATGAALVAQRGPQEEAATMLGVAPAAAAAGLASSTSTMMAASGSATMPTAASVEPLAWSEDSATDDIAPAAYFDNGDGNVGNGARPQMQFQHPEQGGFEELPPLPWYRRPGVLFGAAAGAVLVAVAGLILTMQVGGVGTTPAGTNGTPAPAAVPPAEVAPPPVEAPPPAPETVIVERPAPKAPPRQQAPVGPRPAAPPPAPNPVGPPPAANTPPTPVSPVNPNPECTENCPDPGTGGTGTTGGTGGTGTGQGGTGTGTGGTGTGGTGTGQGGTGQGGTGTGTGGTGGTGTGEMGTGGTGTGGTGTGGTGTGTGGTGQGGTGTGTGTGQGGGGELPAGLCPAGVTDCGVIGPGQGGAE